MFKKLNENIHCNDDTKAMLKGEAGYDRFHKLRPVVNVLNNRQKEVYFPSSVMAVDGSMVPFNGRSLMKQFLYNDQKHILCSCKVPLSSFA
jgi:hypothetical protein